MNGDGYAPPDEGDDLVEPVLAPLQRIESRSLVELAASAIRQLILSGDIEQGARLIEERLVEQLGISRPPLREALRLLQREGLVVNVPRRGSIVAPLTSQDMLELVTLRTALDRLAIELGVPVTDPQRLERCRMALQTLERGVLQQESRAALVNQSFEFHLSVAMLPGHGRLEQIYRSLGAQMRLYMATDLRARQELELETPEMHLERHRRLLELIARGDKDAALAETAGHIDRVPDRSQTGLQEPVGGTPTANSAFAGRADGG